MVSRGHCGINFGFIVSDLPVKSNIVGVFVVYERSTRSKGFFGVCYGLQNLIFYINCFGSISSNFFGFGHYHRYAIACVFYFIQNQKWVLWLTHGSAIFEIDLPTTRHTVDIFKVFACINSHHTFHG